MYHGVHGSDDLRKTFSGLVERALYVDLGICEPSIADYLTDLMVDFNHVDHIYALRASDGHRLHHIAEMIAEAELGPDTQEPVSRRIVHRHVGDFALFWLGVFPEALRRLTAPTVAGAFVDVVDQGKRSYAIASDLTDRDDEPPRDLLMTLSKHFEQCATGLGLVRRGLERLSPDGFVDAHEPWSD